MDGLALQLPKHLYTEVRNEDGAVTGVTYAADKLARWSGHGCGGAVGKLCQEIYSSELEAIAAREEHQLLLLEEQWLKLENGIDDEAEEAQYDLACEAVCQEAQAERQAAREQMQRRRAAIDKLVNESMEHVANNSPAQQEGYLGYLVALAMLAGVVYVLLT